MNNKKTLILVLAIAALAFASLGLMDIIKSKEYNVDKPTPTATPNLLEKKLLVRNQDGLLDNGVYTITGQVLNNTDEDYSSYELVFNLYNSSNAKITSCSTTGSELKKEQSVDFTVICDNVSNNIAYYSLSKLEGIK